MLKYRRLNKEELESLEDEFIKYLATQSISAPDWLRIKEEDEEKQEELINLFSNIVMERVLSNISYLEITTKDEIKVFYMKEDSGTLVGLKTSHNEVDFLNDEQLNSFFGDTDKMLSYKLKVYKLEKKYTKPKAEEAFFLIKMGARITDKKMFELIEALIK